jgi:hypothetical protein
VPLNVGDTLTTARVSFGPGVVAIGVTGATPTANIGYLGDDALELEWNNEMGEITQGNPKIPFLQFCRAQNFFARWTSIEWSASRLAYATGAGVTTINSNNEIMDFGGDPSPYQVAILIQHRKATATHTINVRIWTAGPETGTVSTQLGDEVHGFGLAFKALRSTTSWAGATLASDSQLVQLDIQLQ